MKWIYAVFGIFLLLALCSIPVAAVDDLTVSEYQIMPWFDSSVSELRSSQSSSVVQNGVEKFDYYVSSGCKQLDIKVSWDLLPNYNSLTLRLFTPKGFLVGEYTDTYESSVKNGIIPIAITSSSPLESGYWRSEVVGTKVSGSQPFNIIINSR
ncbi:hypothetical protein [Methanorbis furvi]|uniref:Uncharacterized protein n=1 Tax=Methanorbis furvi TaxID=3028299 RepID=A0AAE4S9G0_9EURY|nr:hypothetical protein [Methanocorpusculaceae archaeon Ag1]